MQAINSKNQGKVNMCVKALIAYNELNNQRDDADGQGDEKLVNVLNRKCEAKFNRFTELLESLPKYEQKPILASELY